ncbi:unnamed protein product [Schistosoma margrebowiei]|uniref:Uncharacterized protein n=1 Tax=Schistosoma margrebowiei TaxID=48269 RepID=A0A3P8HG95_9TREM|nr:unnamed protein product [Schistosoma margrebowiei]
MVHFACSISSVEWQTMYAVAIKYLCLEHFHEDHMQPIYNHFSSLDLIQSQEDDHLVHQTLKISCQYHCHSSLWNHLMKLEYVTVPSLGDVGDFLKILQEMHLELKLLI